MDIETHTQEVEKAPVSVADADWTLIFYPSTRGCPDVMSAIGVCEVRAGEVCTGKMHGVWAAVREQSQIPLLHCHPVDEAFLMRIMTFMGTWYRANMSGMFSTHKPRERDKISPRRLAAIMREPENQVAYGLRLLSVDEAVMMSQRNGKTEFAFNKLFI